MRSATTLLFSVVLASTNVFQCGIARAETGIPKLPSQSSGRFLGVATCASSQCHASPQPWRNATVSMKEGTIWKQHDSHAKSFEVLRSPTGKKIANRLGLSDAGSSAACLTCHATFPPKSQRGQHFAVESGVSCESCHGAGGDFLKAHLSPANTHAGSVAAGMFPTDRADARAALCMSCHRGDESHEMTHKIYAAGHPRLRFELDTFSANQPPHFIADNDYRRRKGAPSALVLWQEGQLRAAKLLLAEAEAMTGGQAPNLAHLDCFSCHQKSISTDSPQGPRPGLITGQPYLPDAPLVLLRAASVLVDPKVASDLLKETRALQLNLGDPELRTEPLKNLKDMVAKLGNSLRQRSEKSGDVMAVVRSLVAGAIEESPAPYGLAEAYAMSISTLVTSLHDKKHLSDEQYKPINNSINRLYASLKNENAYDAAKTTEAFEALSATLSRSR